MANPAVLVHGPALIGIFFNLILYGIMITQTFLYYSAFKHDHLYMKAYVMLLFLTDTVNSIFNMIWIYNVLINNFGNPEALEVGNWVFATDPAIVGLTAMFSELFFAWRIKVLTQRTWLAAIVGITSIVSGLAGVAVGTAIGSFVPLFENFHKFTPVVIVWHIAAALSDSIIAVVLTYTLRKRRTGFSGTDHILDRIVRMTIQTGFVTALWSVADLICFLAIDTAIYLSFNFPLAKLHTNAVMSSLNSRGKWQYSGVDDGTSGASGQNSVGVASARSYRTKPRINRIDVASPRQGAQVFVDVETHEMVDVLTERQPSKAGHDWSLKLDRNNSMTDHDVV